MLTRTLFCLGRLFPMGNRFMMSKIPPPKNPTMTESFGVKMSEDEMQVILDPRGFLTEEEKELAE